MSSRTHSQRGFTLTEVLVATAIFAIILIAALLVYDRSNKVFKAGVEAAEMQQNTRIAFDRMVADLRLAGYDHDRDGIPTALDQHQQPDEQIEYAGTHAITLRSNFDYESGGPPGYGRESTLESPNSEFPIVTTGNDEIVTYALVPDTAGSTTETLVFHADVTDGTIEKRQSYPDGEAEDTIRIDGVDLCATGCNQPPYTLYRFTVAPNGSVTRTPLANNVRDLQLTYYQDILGETPLTIDDPGGGIYDPKVAGSMSGDERTERARIRGIRVRLIGLSESNDPSWVQPGETIPAVRNRRQYALESLISPRNLGKHGMREQATAGPGAPTLKAVCFKYCSTVRVTWDPPAEDPSYGDVETYYVLWDTDWDWTLACPNPTAGKTDQCGPPQESMAVGLANEAYVYGLDANTKYRFTVASTNSYGTQYAAVQITGTPLNGTTPDIATLEKVSTDGENQITLEWKLPTTNIGGANQESCIGPDGVTEISSDVVPPQKKEMKGIEIHRSEDKSFVPSASTLVATAPWGTSYVDTTAANCIKYYYRIRVAEHCDDAAENLAGISGFSEYDPKSGDNGIEGESILKVEPMQPGPLVVAGDPASSCTAGKCKVTMSWPIVTTDLAGNRVTIDQYDVQILQNGVEYGGGPATDVGPTITNGVATWVATDLPEKDGAGTDYKYEFAARAVQCGIPGEYSKSDNYPKCKFGGGSTLKVSMSGVHDGDGTSGDDPFQITGSEVISFELASGGNLSKVSATVVEVASGSEIATLGPANGPAAKLTLTWPDSGDDRLYRVDYVVTDDSTPDPCSQSGSFYVKEVSVVCPFTVPATVTQNLLTTTGSGGSNPWTKFALKNTTAFDVTISKADITWSKTIGKPTNKSVTITSVTFPSSAGSGTVNATLSGTTSSGATSGVFDFAASTSSAAKLFSNDTTGNYFFTVNFSVQSNEDLVAQPITNVVISYKLPGDAVSDPVRTCDVF